ncbi:MAG: helix-turn-helix transcriptional regulator [Clostridia bacterium]|nr:helix-turn-helix transcriptional regulator [Clostridia bacterium]
MDLIKTGKFIQQQRKAKKLTQMQLAVKLNISEKTISKWECGKGFPDTSLILPLCKELGITANELLSAQQLESEQEYKTNAEQNIITLKTQQEHQTKFLLLTEYFLVWFSIAILLVCACISSLSALQTLWRVLLIVFGVVNALIGCFIGFHIEIKAGFYQCKHCSHKYIPTYRQAFWAMHIGRTRYMKCPHCHKSSWHKKTTSAN